MARIELLKELSIRRKEIYSQLEVQFPELMEELDAIDKIIGRAKNTNLMQKDNVSSKNLNGTPKGNMSWEDYVLHMLNEIGGKGKATDVAKAIQNANDDVTFQRAKDAASNKLSKLNRIGKVNAIKGNTQKDGYIYEVI